MSGVSSADLSNRIADDFYQDKYKTTVDVYSTPNPAEMEKQVQKQLSDRIISKPLEKDGIFETHIVDCVKVRAVADTVRRQRIDAWNEKKSEAESSAWKWGIGGTVVAVIGLGVAFSSENPILGGVIFLAGAVAGLYKGLTNANASSEASKKIAGWSKNPREEVAKERKLAFESGFIYTYNNNLKLSTNRAAGEILHPLEVEMLYKKYTNNFLDTAKADSNNKKSDWVTAFTANNPFSEKLMMYGFGKIPQHLQAVVNDYKTYKSYISDISKGYEKLKQQGREVAQQRIKDINAERDKLLKPFVDEKDAALKKAKEMRDKEILNQVPDAQKNFAAKQQLLETDFKGKTADINKKYDEKVKAVETERDNQLKIWDTKKDDQIGMTYEVGRDLLKKAYAAWTGQTQQYQPVQWVQYGYYPQPVYAQPQAPQPGLQYAPPAQYPPQYAYPQQPAPYHQPYGYPQPARQ